MKSILCFGDSNTYGLKPDGSGRFDKNERWTGILSELLSNTDYDVIEEGLVGRTTVFEDSTRLGRNGSKLLPVLLESHGPVDTVVLMLLSPIYLGEEVWKQEYDPEFDEKSVVTSKELKAVFRKLAEEFDCMFLAASDVAKPSETDQEHMDIESHRFLAEAVYRKLTAA